MNNVIKTNVVILGGGPAGYSAAFRCADLGLKTLLIEKYKNLGGVCLNVGCIPSKSLLYITKIIKEAQFLKNCGVLYNKPKIDINKIKIWKNNIIKKLSNGLKILAKKRKIKIINGFGKFLSKNIIYVKEKNKNTKIFFKNAIIATGSKSTKISFIEKNNKIWNSTDALSLKYIPKKMLIIGGGVIGLEISNIYETLGSKIDIIEISDQIIPVIDKDISKIFIKQIKPNISILLKTKIKNIKIKNNIIKVSIKKSNSKIEYKNYDTILIAIGRVPNINLININKIGLKINEKNFICVNNQMRTNIKNIYAIGDIIGQPMLAHKGIYEGRIVAEIIFGKKHYFDTKIIPNISYTNPEISWVGLTEKEAIKKKISYKTAIFPWSASGKAIISNYCKGITKLIFNKNTNRLIGGALIGTNSGELLGEISLAIEMGCNAKDISLTIHAHPTLYESIGITAEIYEGTVTDLLNNKI